jgi:pimeloyl-ACP methyl ester carboxylesterase
MVRLACSCSPEAVVATVRSFSETDFRADLRAFAGVPTLVVHGDADANVPLDLCGRRTAAAIPGSRLEVYEGAPHGLPITHADRLNRTCSRSSGLERARAGNESTRPRLTLRSR